MKMTILIIEDEIGICNFLSDGLKEEGFSIIVKNSGKEGLDYALNNNIDLLLVDWLLPEINGLDICKYLKEHNPKIPIIFLTSKNTQNDVLEGLRAGAIDYIKKPFNFEELLQRVKNHLYFQNNKTHVLGNLKLNNLRHEATINNHTIHLTPKEYDLLNYLIENKGKVCTRNDIIRNVWNINFDYDTSVIDVYMNSLRKKLNVGVQNFSIKTIRSIGYIAND